MLVVSVLDDPTKALHQRLSDALASSDDAGDRRRSRLLGRSLRRRAWLYRIALSAMLLLCLTAASLALDPSAIETEIAYASEGALAICLVSLLSAGALIGRRRLRSPRRLADPAITRLIDDAGVALAGAEALGVRSEQPGLWGEWDALIAAAAAHDPAAVGGLEELAARALWLRRSRIAAMAGQLDLAPDNRPRAIARLQALLRDLETTDAPPPSSDAHALLGPDDQLLARADQLISADHRFIARSRRGDAGRLEAIARALVLLREGEGRRRPLSDLICSQRAADRALAASLLLEIARFSAILPEVQGPRHAAWVSRHQGAASRDLVGTSHDPS